MRYRATWILAGIALLLGLYLYFVELPARRAGETEQARADKVFHLDPSVIVGAWLEYPREEPRREIVLERPDPSYPWQVVKPLSTEADQAEMQRLLSALDSMRRVRVVEEVGDLGAYGLDAPRIRVLIRSKDHEEHLLVGDSAPIGSTVYVKKIEEDSIQVVEDFYINGLTKTVTDLRRKDVLGVEPDQVETLTLEYPDKVFSLNLEKGDWWLKKPVVEKADQEKVFDYLHSLKAVRAEDFVDEGGAELLKALESPRLKVEAVGGSVTLSKIAFYDRDPGAVYAVVNESPRPIYVVSPEAVSELEVDLFSLKDKHLLDFDPAAVRALELKTDAEAFTLERRGGRWEIEGQPVSASWQDQAALFLDALKEVKAERAARAAIKDPGGYGLQPPLYRFRLLAEGGEVLGDLQVGRQEGELRYARAGDSGPVYLIPGTFLEGIPADRDEGQEGPSE